MTEKRSWTIYESPLGPLTVIAGPAGLTDLNFPGKVPAPPEESRRRLPEVEAQLDAYFAGELRGFELELAPAGTPFQREVWRRLLEIPYGETTSYGELAARIDSARPRPGAAPPAWRARAVGAANGRNPLSIVVPCHRVIGADGSLTGYGGGLQRKQALLDLERGALAGARPDRRTLAQQLPLT